MLLLSFYVYFDDALSSVNLEIQFMNSSDSGVNYTFTLASLHDVIQTMPDENLNDKVKWWTFKISIFCHFFYFSH